MVETGGIEPFVFDVAFLLPESTKVLYLQESKSWPEQVGEQVKVTGGQLHESSVHHRGHAHHDHHHHYADEIVMRTAILLVSMVLLVAPLAIAQPRDDRLIVPGVRIGKWRPGVSIDELVRPHGKANGTFRFLKGSPGDADFLREAL